MKPLKPNKKEIKTLFVAYKNSDHYKLICQNIDSQKFEKLLNTLIQSISEFILNNKTPNFDSLTKRFAITIYHDLCKLDINKVG